MKLLIALAFAFTVSVPAIAEMPKTDSMTPRDLIVAWGQADEECRGGKPDSMDTAESCVEREVIQNDLEKRGYCLPGPTVTETWKPCTRL